MPADSYKRRQLLWSYFVLLVDENKVFSLLRGSKRDSLSWKTPSATPPTSAPLPPPAIPITPSSPPSLLPEVGFLRHQFGNRRMFASEKFRVFQFHSYFLPSWRHGSPYGNKFLIVLQPCMIPLTHMLDFISCYTDSLLFTTIKFSAGRQACSHCARMALHQPESFNCIFPHWRGHSIISFIPTLPSPCSLSENSTRLSKTTTQ